MPTTDLRGDLSNAAARGDTAALTSLIAKGADVNSKDDQQLDEGPGLPADGADDTAGLVNRAHRRGLIALLEVLSFAATTPPTGPCYEQKGP